MVIAVFLQMTLHTYIQIYCLAYYGNPICKLLQQVQDVILHQIGSSKYKKQREKGKGGKLDKYCTIVHQIFILYSIKQFEPTSQNLSQHLKTQKPKWLSHLGDEKMVIGLIFLTNIEIEFFEPRIHNIKVLLYCFLSYVPRYLALGFQNSYNTLSQLKGLQSCDLSKLEF